MRLKQVKKQADVKIVGVHVELDVVNDMVKSVQIQDIAGNVLKIAVESYNEIRVYTQADPEMKKVHVVSGTIRGIPFREEHDDSSAARGRKRELEDVSDDITINEEEVPVEEETPHEVVTVDDLINF